jgi:excisionase family DNA binding protein
MKLVITSPDEEVFVERLVDIETAARLLGGVSPWTVRAWLSKGRLSKVKVGRRTMITKAELDRFIQQCQSTEQSHQRARAKAVELQSKARGVRP